MHPPPLFAEGNLQPNLKKKGGGLDRTLLCRGGLLGKRQVTINILGVLGKIIFSENTPEIDDPFQQKEHQNKVFKSAQN